MTKTGTPAQARQTNAAPLDAEHKTSWMPHLMVLGLVVVLAIVYVLMQSGAVEAPQRTPTRFLLPDGFSGPVKVYYNVAGATPLPEVDGYRIAEVPPSGVLLTSSEPLYGQALDLFIRVEDDGTEETLGYHFIRDRKGGVTGDNKEYFLRPEELAQRDGELIRWGITTPEGGPKYGVAYELFTVRDDF